VSGTSSDLVPSTPSDGAEVEGVARDYIDGWYAGDVGRMDRALHAELVKRIPGGEEPGPLREVSKARMLALTADGGGDAPETEAEIIVDDVSGDIATVRVLSPDYLDYLHVAKTSDGWKIVNVLFHSRS
jgi:hypothetical protein